MEFLPAEWPAARDQAMKAKPPDPTNDISFEADEYGNRSTVLAFGPGAAAVTRDGPRSGCSSSVPRTSAAGRVAASSSSLLGTGTS